MIKAKTKIISKQEKLCKSLCSQALGLMFRPKQNLIMIFSQERQLQLHNWFVFYPIELVFLDKNKKVIEINPDFKPFRFYTSKHKVKYLLELAVQESKGRVRVGDILYF